MQITLTKTQMKMILRALDFYIAVCSWRLFKIIPKHELRTIDTIRDKLRGKK